MQSAAVCVCRSAIASWNRCFQLLSKLPGERLATDSELVARWQRESVWVTEVSSRNLVPSVVVNREPTVRNASWSLLQSRFNTETHWPAAIYCCRD